jgi:hypothetical protein
MRKLRGDVQAGIIAAVFLGMDDDFFSGHFYGSHISSRICRYSLRRGQLDHLRYSHSNSVEVLRPRSAGPPERSRSAQLGMPRVWIVLQPLRFDVLSLEFT